MGHCGRVAARDAALDGARAAASTQAKSRGLRGLPAERAASAKGLRQDKELGVLWVAGRPCDWDRQRGERSGKRWAWRPRAWRALPGIGAVGISF